MHSESICPPVPLLSAFPDVNLDPHRRSKGKMCIPFSHICLSKNVPEAISVFSDLEVDRRGLSKEESGTRSHVMTLTWIELCLALRVMISLSIVLDIVTEMLAFLGFGERGLLGRRTFPSKEA